MVTLPGLFWMGIRVIPRAVVKGHARELLEACLIDPHQVIFGSIVKRIVQVAFNVAAAGWWMFDIPTHRAWQRFLNGQQVTIPQVGFEL